MPTVRLLVPVSIEGEPYAAGEEVEVDDAVFASLRADGKASSLDEEKAAAQRASEGNYSARVGREDVGGSKEPAPKAEDKTEKKR